MKIKGALLAALTALVLAALPAAAAQPSWIFILTFNTAHRLVPGPPTTAKLLYVATTYPLYCSDNTSVVTRVGNVIDIAFAVSGCVTIGEPPPRGDSGYFGYLPAGTYTARRLFIHPDGGREVDDTLTFEVLDAGPPLDIPALSSITLAALAILIGAIAIKNIR